MLYQSMHPMIVIPAVDRGKGQNEQLKVGVLNPHTNIIYERAIPLMSASGIPYTLHSVYV